MKKSLFLSGHSLFLKRVVTNNLSGTLRIIDKRVEKLKYLHQRVIARTLLLLLRNLQSKHYLTRDLQQITKVIASK